MAFRRRSGFLTVSLIGALTLAACGGGGDGDGGDGDGDGAEVEESLELFSWWTGGGEAAALDALLAVYNESYPDVEVINAAATKPETARERLADRMAANDPPDSFQGVSGLDILSYAKDGKLESLTELSEEKGWEDVIPPTVFKILSIDDELYGVPANIERDNNMYYNIKVFEDNNVPMPTEGDLTNRDSFYAACATFQEAGINPLSVPAAGWVLALVAFENLMPAVLGGEYYMDFFEGTAPASGVEDQMTLLFTELAKVLACSNVAEPNDNWNRWDTHADTLRRGESAMYVMGDWGKGYLETSAEWDGTPVDPFVAGEDFGVVPGLGGDGYFTFNSAVFGVPKNAQHPNAALAFVDTVVSAEGQEAFNLKKGSVPANTDTPTDQFDAMVAEAKADFDEAGAGDNKLLPGYASLTTFDYQVEMNPALLVFAVGGARASELDPDNVPAEEEAFEALDVDYIVSKMVSTYGILQNQD